MEAESVHAAVRVRVRAFSRSLPMTLLLAREAVMDRIRPLLLAHDLTEQQWRVLHALASAGEQDAAVLARASGLLPPSLSRVLRDLQRRGLLRRRQVAGDRRRAVIALDRQGEALVAALAPLVEAAYARIVGTLGRDRVEELQRLLGELVAGLEALDRDEDAPGADRSPRRETGS